MSRLSNLFRTRNNELNIRFIAFLILTAIIFGCLFGFTGHASAQTVQEPYKYYTTYRVCQGDTLNSIATRYYRAEYNLSFKSYVNEIAELNELRNPDCIKDGDTLFVPYFSEELK